MGARERALLSTCTTACCWPQCGAMPLFASFTAMRPAYAGRTTLPPTSHIRRALAVAVFGSWCTFLSRSACLPWLLQGTSERACRSSAFDTIELDEVRARRVRLGSRPLTHGNTEVWRVGALSAPARGMKMRD